MRLGFALPVIFIFLVFRWISLGSGYRLGWRETWLYTAAITGVYVVAMTETLSAVHALTTFWVVLFWAMGCMALLFVRVGVESQVRQKPFSRPISFFRNSDWLPKILAMIMLMIAGILAVIALYGVPNTYDSMTYHLARVAHWLQNRSVAIYATNCMYQNQHSPFAEWSLLQIVLLQGNDHLVNFVQWLSYAGSILAVSLIVEVCGGTKRAAVIAAFFAATLPMAILQASTTQNDEVLSFWLLCTAYGCLKAGRDPTWPHLFLFSASLGLALLTKVLAYLYAPVFCIGLTLALFWSGLRFAFPRLMAVALLTLVLNSGYYIRNWESTGTLVGMNRDSGPGYSYENEIHTPGAIFSNIIRNLSLNAPQNHNSAVETYLFMVRIHRMLGLDPSDPRTTTYAPFYYIPQDPDETECASPLHAAMMGLSFILLLIAARRFTNETRLLAASVVAGAFLLCLVLKWQPFHTRLQLPLFFLAIPVIAVVFETFRFRALTLLLVGLLLVEALPLIFNCFNHPLMAKANIFNSSLSVRRFAFRPEILPEYETTLQLLRDSQAKNIGVISPPNNSGWEYPLFDPDRMNYGYPWHVEQVQVQNCYAPLESRDSVDAVVSLWPSNEEFCTIHGHRFHRVLEGHAVTVYLK